MNTSFSSWLPQELLILISSNIEISREGLIGLTSCTMASRSLRSAATMSLIWEPHYKAVYPNCEIGPEKDRCEECKGDWYRMFLRRVEIDGKAKDLVRLLCGYTDIQARESAASILVKDMGMDIWDVLRRESNLPGPPLFDQEEDSESPVNKHATRRSSLTMKYWADELQGVLARRHGIARWAEILRVPPNSDCPTYEEAIACLSAFWEIHPNEIMKHYDELAEGCRSYFNRNNIEYRKDSTEFNAEVVSQGICDFMTNEGFHVVDNNNFYEVRNSFPHYYLTTQKHTLPISLTCVFVAIARRLGLPATPLDLPVRVRALLDHTVVDVCSKLPDAIKTYNQIPEGMFNLEQSASQTRRMLMRTQGNILMSLHSGGGAISYDSVNIKDKVVFAAVFLSILFDRGSFHVNAVKHPLDRSLVVRDVLLPKLDEIGGDLTQSRREAATTALQFEDFAFPDTVPSRRNLRDTDRHYFIGQIITNHSGQLGCIIKWTLLDQGARNPDFPESDSAEFLVQLASGDKLTLNSLGLEPASNLTKQNIRNMVRSVPWIRLYFADAEWNEGRGRFIMHDGLKAIYRDDGVVGAKWVREGAMNV